MNKVMLYCEMNDLTGFGHYNRMKILLKIMNLKNVDIITDNLKIAKIFFTNQNVLKVSDALEYIKKNYKKYDLLIIDPPYYPNIIDQQKKFSLDFKKIYNLKDKNFKVIWFTDEENPSPKYCDLLLNDYPLSISFKKFYKKYNKNIELILGLYAFLFADEVLKLRNFSKKKHVLIAFGGNDPKNLVLKYFNFFKKIKYKKIFISNSKTYKILKKYSDNKNLFIKKKTPMDQFIKILASSYFYIGTPSNIMFEALALGVRGNVIPTQKRQVKMGKAFAIKNYINLLPYYKNLNIAKLRKEINLEFSNKLKFNFNEKLVENTRKKLINFLGK